MQIYPDTIVIDEQTAEKLILNAIVGGSPDIAPEDELVKLVEWATAVALEYELLQLCLGGDMLVSMDGDEPRFRCSTDSERRYLEATFELLDRHSS